MNAIARRTTPAAQAECIRFAVTECTLGALLVAATDKGICGILFGDTPDAAVRNLRERFPDSSVEAGGRDIERQAAAVTAFVEAPAQGLGLPLDLHGTPFQRRVWDALRAIAPGSTASYAEIARQIGQPAAVRAVARACAANPIAVAVPCHRVVRQDGGLSGYRWGVARKRALLGREAA